MKITQGQLAVRHCDNILIVVQVEQIFNPCSDFLISLSEACGREDTAEENECQRGERACSKSSGSWMTELGPKAQSCDIFRGHCSYFLLWLKPVSAPPVPTPRTKGNKQKASETNIRIPGQRVPCSLPSLPSALIFSPTGSSSFTVWLSFPLLCSLDLVNQCLDGVQLWECPSVLPPVFVSERLEKPCPSIEDTPSHWVRDWTPCDSTLSKLRCINSATHSYVFHPLAFTHTT